MHRFELAVDVAYHNLFGFKRRELSAASRCLDCDYSISDPLLQNSDKNKGILIYYKIFEFFKMYNIRACLLFDKQALDSYFKIIRLFFEPCFEFFLSFFA